MPRVIMLTGKLIMLKIGFNSIKSKERTIPAVKSVQNPPVILAPGTSWIMRKRHKVKREILRSSDFMSKIHSSRIFYFAPTNFFSAFLLSTAITLQI